jgi:NADH-quinone oxidoreductase subunit E/NADP-reducing hydrogenase subunit HndA
VDKITHISAGGKKMNETMEMKLRDVADYVDTLKLEGKDQEVKRSYLIHTLHKAQEIIGYLPVEVQKLIAKKLGLHASEVYGVVSFYNYFTMKPKGLYPINLCLGTACYVRGSGPLYEELKKLLGVEEGEVTSDGIFSLHAVRCLGACGLAPVLMIGEKVHGRLKKEDLPRILEEYRQLAKTQNV